MTWLMQNYGLVATVLLGVLESASLIPGVGASGYVKFIMMLVRLVATKDPIPSDAPQSAKVASTELNPKI